MSWAGIANNQTVTCNNLQDAVNTGVFYQKNTIPATNECITKADAEYYVDINAISGKTSNQLVVKSNLVSPGYYYQMERYNCANCNGDEVYIVGYSSTPLTLNYFYAGISPYSYQRQAQISSTTVDINFTGVTGTASCISCITCTTWTFSNSSPDFGNYVDYIDCSNVSQSVYVPELSAPQYCVRVGTTPTTNAEYITLTNTTETCI